MTQRRFHEIYDLPWLHEKLKTQTPHELARGELKHLGDTHTIASAIWFVVKTKFPESWQAEVKHGKPGRPKKPVSNPRVD